MEINDLLLKYALFPSATTFKVSFLPTNVCIWGWNALLRGALLLQLTLPVESVHESHTKVVATPKNRGITAVCKTFLMFIRCTYMPEKVVAVMPVLNSSPNCPECISIFKKKIAAFFRGRFSASDNLGEPYVVCAAISIHGNSISTSNTNSHVDPFRMPNEWLVSVSGAVCRRLLYWRI